MSNCWVGFAHEGFSLTVTNELRIHGGSLGIRGEVVTLAGDVVPLAERQDDLPPDFAHMVMALLASEPDRRPTAAAVVELLEQAVAEGDLEWRADDLPGDP